MVGLTNVTTSIAWVGFPHPVVSKMIFFLDTEYVATIFQPPFNFVLPSDYFVDGVGTRSLSVTASLSDGLITDPAAVNLNLDNNTTTTPLNNTPFTPYVPSSPGNPMVVAATGDGASGETPGVTNQIATWNPKLMLYLGDVYEKGTYTEFYNLYGTASTFFGQFRNITNPVIGNHEYENGVAPGYFYYWGAIPNYYSYDAGGWHFIALNSTSEANQTAPGSAQYQWLVNDLATNNAQCTIAYFHHPVYNIGPEGDTPRMAPIWDLLYLNGIDVVLTGHDHNYQRWKSLDLNGNLKSNAITQFVAGAGGHGTQTFVNPSDPRVQFATDVSGTAFGALRLQLSSSSMFFEYINSVGTVLDSGTIPCHAPPVDNTPPTAPSNLTSSLNSSGHVVLQWGASTDATRVNGYTIYRDGNLLTTVSGVTTTYTDITGASNTPYTYTVDAYDMNNNHSALSNPSSITTPKFSIITVPITIDSYVTDANMGANFGNSIQLRTDASPIQRSYLRLDVPTLPGNVILATLQVYANSSSTTGYTVYNTGGGWGETTINFSNAPALGTSIVSSGTFPVSSWTSVDITSLITGSGQYNVVMATGSTTGAVFSSSEGANPPKLILKVAGIPPDNDDFSNSITIASLPYSNPQTTESATVQNSEQAASCEGSANIKNTVWYSYTAVANQRVSFSVTGSRVVNGISVWTGSTLGGLTEVGCGIGMDTSAKADATNGTLYYIRIGSSNGVNSNFTVQADVAPANDDFANAITIDAISTGFAPFNDTQNVVGAGIETNEPAATCGAIPAFRTVWYTYTALDQHTMLLDTTGSDYDTTLSVWTGSGPGSLTQVGCNDNNGALLTSALTMNTTLGMTYFIRVSSNSGTDGNLKFNALIATVANAAPLRNYYTTATPTLTWSRVSGATQYMIQVSKSAIFNPLVYPAVIVPANQLSLMTAALPGEGVYYWRVSANNGVTWSVVERFIVDLP